MAVAEVGDADADGEVEIALAADHGHVAAGAGFNHFGGEPTDAFGDVFDAELAEALGGSSHV